MADFFPSAVAFRLERHYAFEGGVIEIGRYRWFQPMEEDVSSHEDNLVLNLALGSRPVHTRVDRIDTEAEPAAGEVGRLLVMMPRATYRLSAPTGAFRSLRCRIGCEKLAAVLGEEIDWSQLSELGGELKPGTDIERLLTRMHAELVQDRVGRAGAIEGCAQLLCVELVRHFRTRRPLGRTVHTGGLSAWRLRTIMNRIHAALPAPKVVELAQLCGLTERQLSRAFKAETGASIGHFVSEFTMERAHRLLTTTRRPLVEIARELGYASVDSFAQSYRRVTGVPPSRARQQ